jgi:hypothetical protein
LIHITKKKKKILLPIFFIEVLTSDHYVHIDLFAIAIDRCCLSSNDKQKKEKKNLTIQ